MNLHEANQVVDFFTKSRDQVKTDILNVLKDTFYPLPERWELFKKCPADLLKTETYGPPSGLDTLAGHEIVWYDDFYIERHETVDSVDIVERMEENLTSTYSSQFFERHTVTQADIDAYKEAVLQSGVKEWEYDW